MKKIRLWLNSFSLLQQFLGIALLTCVFLVFFFFTTMNNQIDAFVNTQMFNYLHQSQNDYIEAQRTLRDYEDSNAYHYVYSKINHKYLNYIPDEELEILEHINPSPEEGSIDSIVEVNDIEYVYSIVSYHNDYSLVSIIKNTYRTEFRTALLNGVINISFVAILCFFVLFMIWVVSLLTPLNQIKTYINKIKNGEDAKLSINRQDEIGEVAEAITSMHEELDHQQRIREEMIQNISHDLKTPIATIKSYSESIKDGVYPYDTLEKSVDVISEHADRLEKKVYNLISYNKYGYLKDNDEYSSVDMVGIIEKAILSMQVIRNDIKISTELKENVSFHGEEEPWRVVVENLLDNAIRYSITYVRVVLNDGLFEVYNDGKPMSKDRIDKLFKPYEKGTNGQFGLGLSIVKKVTDTYGYGVTGENTDDGAVFRVYQIKKPKKRKANKV